MENDKPMYVHRVVRRNKVADDRTYWYSKPPGMDRLRIPHLLGTTMFNDFAEKRNREAFALATPLDIGTFDHLAVVFRGDPDHKPHPIAPLSEWTDLKEKTRKDYSRIINKEILPRFGKYYVRDLDAEMVLDLKELFVGKKRMGNYVLAVLSQMVAIAKPRISLFGMTHNPCMDVPRFGRKSGLKARQSIWTYADEQRFLNDAHETDPMMAVNETLLAFTGQRPGDVRSMQVKHYDGEKIAVRQSKTDALVWIPAHKKLKAYLDPIVAERRAKGGEEAFLVQCINGEPMGERYAATRWDEVAARTKCDHLQRRDLRRTAVVRMHEAGCSIGQIIAITGHTLRSALAILETYTVMTYEAAKEAVRKVEEYDDRREAEAA